MKKKNFICYNIYNEFLIKYGGFQMGNLKLKDKEKLLNYLFEYFPKEDAIVQFYNILKK
jgi:hypothetical protein